MRRLIAWPFKAVRRGLVIVCGLVIAISLDLAERNGFLYWPFAAEALGMVPFTFGWQLRQEVYRRLGVCRGTNTVLHHGTTICDRRTTIGNDVWVSRNVYLEYAHIGDHVLIGPHAVLLAGRHHHKADNLDQPIKLQGNNPLAPIKIGDGAWIGANATVMADVGHDAIVAAGAIVIDPVPDYAIVAGNPARLIRDRRHPPSPVIPPDFVPDRVHETEIERAQVALGDS